MKRNEPEIIAAAREAEELLAELIGIDLVDEEHPYAERVEAVRKRLAKAINASKGAA